MVDEDVEAVELADAVWRFCLLLGDGDAPPVRPKSREFELLSAARRGNVAVDGVAFL